MAYEQKETARPCQLKTSRTQSSSKKEPIRQVRGWESSSHSPRKSTTDGSKAAHLYKRHSTNHSLKYTICQRENKSPPTPYHHHHRHRHHHVLEESATAISECTQPRCTAQGHPLATLKGHSSSDGCTIAHPSTCAGSRIRVNG